MPRDNDDHANVRARDAEFHAEARNLRARDAESRAEAPPDAGERTDVPGDDPAVRVRQIGSDWETALPNAEGTRVITIGQTGRIEVRLPRVDDSSYSGFLQANGERRPLPLGSSLDSRAGIFYWQPAAGFLGAYDLVFSTTDSAPSPVRVRVIVGPSMEKVGVRAPTVR
jgi:hypothetical protein